MALNLTECIDLKGKFSLRMSICFALIFLPCLLSAKDLCLQDRFYLEDSFIDECRTAQGYNNSYFSSLGEYLRDKYFTPLNQEEFITPYFIDCEQYASNVTHMLKTGEGPFDPTFVNFSQIAKQFFVRDISVELQSSEKIYLFHARVIESRYGSKFRIILFSFNENQEKEGENWISWNPTSCAEIGAGALEVLKAFKQHIAIDSMMCFSLGGVTFDALQYLKEDFLPKTLLWNRCLTSTWKAGLSMVSYPTNCFLYWATSYYGLYANPEQILADYYAQTRDKRLVVIEATEDSYFSRESGLDQDFFDTLSDSGVDLYNGKFQVPLLTPRAHHTCRFDWIVNHNTGNMTENFLPMNPYETLSDCIVRNLFLEKEGHTCFIVGGTLDTLDSMVYLHALPLLSSYCKLVDH